jgi:hypothetical protein
MNNALLDFVVLHEHMNYEQLRHTAKVVGKYQVVISPLDRAFSRVANWLAT